MPTRSAQAIWEGTLTEGKGIMKLGSGAFEGGYTFATRFQDEPGTNPEELIGAAHAGCFSMALSKLLEKAGHAPRRIQTVAEVRLANSREGVKIKRIVLKTEADVPGIDTELFQKQAKTAKIGCPVSQALARVPIELQAELIS